MELAKSGSNTASKRWTLIAMILASGIVFLDGTVVNVALPSIDRELNAGLSGLQWIVDGYALTLSAFLILGGAIGDQYGRRRTMLGGLAGFGIASAACGLVTGPEWLVLARLVQGIAGAFLVPGSLAVITAVFNDNSEEQGKAIGTWAGWSGITTVIGPLLGGWLVDNLSWRWIFFINVPFVAVTFWLILSRVPETSDRKAGRKLDWMGAVLAVIGLGGTIFGLIEGPVAGWNQTGIVLALVIGVLALIAFVIVEFRVPDPMMPPRLFRIRNFTGVNLATFGVYFALAGMSFFVTIYVQSIMGYPAFFAGLAFFPISVIMLLFSSRAGRLAGKYGGRIFMTVG
ncbi:MAG TPA: MFS transporter, partial [Chloroflexia bacterium]|nr:MFS transporter [Chloroflexia bacterium]